MPNIRSTQRRDGHPLPPPGRCYHGGEGVALIPAGQKRFSVRSEDPREASSTSHPKLGAVSRRSPEVVGCAGHQQLSLLKRVLLRHHREAVDAHDVVCSAPRPEVRIHIISAKIGTILRIGASNKREPRLNFLKQRVRLSSKFHDVFFLFVKHRLFPRQGIQHWNGRPSR